MTELRENWVYRRGDIYIANLNPFKGSEQGGGPDRSLFFKTMTGIITVRH